MHYKKNKRRNNVVREFRRHDNKRHRQADRQALEGGKPRQVRDCSWSHRPEPSLVLDRPNPVKNGSKASPKKERCPSNPDKRAHEFVQDGWPSKRLNRWWHYGLGQKYENVTEYHRLCLHCGKEQWKTKCEGKFKYGNPWRDNPPTEGE
jgi:hypothetical protein